MNTFTSFDGTRIAYHDEGEGPAVILVHGFGTDGLTQFGDFDRLRGQFDKLLALFREHMGFEPPLPEPPAEGRPGLIPRLRAAGARVVVPDLRGFGASDKPRDPAAYAHSAMARDVLALIEHLGLGAADVLGFSMGSLTAAQLLALGAAPGDVLSLYLKSGMRLAGLGSAIGLVAALALARLMASMLYGVSAADPVTIATVAIVLLSVALLACYIPARRATKVDPMVALRFE